MEVNILGERIGDEGQDFLVLIEQEHSAQITQTLIRETGGSEQLQALDLTKVGAFAQGEEVEELGDIVPSAVAERGGGYMRACSWWRKGWHLLTGRCGRRSLLESWL